MAGEEYTHKRSNQGHMHMLFNSGKYYDFEITCQGQCWKVHRAIIFPRCDFFRACLQSQFKEGVTQCVDLPHDDPDIIAGVLNYLYTLEYPYDRKRALLAKTNPTITSHNGPNSDLCAHWTFDLEVLKAAHRLDIRPLEAMARTSFEFVCNKIPANFPRLIPGYVSLVKQFYDDDLVHTMPNMLQALIKTTAPVAAENLSTHPALQTLVEEYPDFSASLITALSLQLSKTEEQLEEEKKKEKKSTVIKTEQNRSSRDRARGGFFDGGTWQNDMADDAGYREDDGQDNNDDLHMALLDTANLNSNYLAHPIGSWSVAPYGLAARRA